MESDSSSLLASLSLALSFILFALSSLAEASLKSVRLERVQLLVSEGVRGSRRLESLILAPSGPAGAVGLLKQVFAAATLLSGVALIVALGGTAWWVIALGSLAVFATLGIAHVATRALGRVLGERVSLRIAPSVRALNWLLRPVLALAVEADRRTARAIAEASDSQAGAVTPNEVEAAPLDEHEVRMIRGVVRLDRTIAREIMVPRVDMVTVEFGTPLGALAEQMVESGHSRMPVHDGNLDQIEGIVYARDIIRHLGGSEEAPETLTASEVRPPMFIPESKPLEELLAEFQEQRVHMAIVVDEYGGVSGLVTIEDLLEEIVGEIQDEFDVTESRIEPVRENEFVIDARVGIDELNELLRADLEGDGFDTLGGFVYQRLGKIPSRGDKVEYDGLKIEVLSTVGRRLKKLRVTRSA